MTVQFLPVSSAKTLNSFDEMSTYFSPKILLQSNNLSDYKLKIQTKPRHKDYNEYIGFELLIGLRTMPILHNKWCPNMNANWWEITLKPL